MFRPGVSPRNREGRAARAKRSSSKICDARDACDAEIIVCQYPSYPRMAWCLLWLQRRYLLFKFWQARLSFFWILLCVLDNYVSFNIEYWYRTTMVLKFYFKARSSRLDQRQTVVRATAFHSFLPKGNSLPSSIAFVDPRSPNNVTVLLDNYHWRVKIRQSSDFFNTNVCTIPSRHYKDVL